jgi:gluconolactonase
MPDLKEITTGLRFPEGPVCLSDGSVLVVEIAAGRLTKVAPGGAKTVVAETGGGPNGAAIGPDGACYLCNNGGFEWHEVGGLTFPGVQASDYTGGSLQRVDLATGAVETVYTHCGEVQLRGPNDLVFDAEGGVWFTDLGKTRERDRDRTGVFYARPDGSFITEAIFPLDMPNGIGLSPEGDRLYVAETPTARVFWFEIEGPGRIKPNPFSPNGGHLLVTLPGLKLLDSLAVDAEGNVCVATLMEGGITTISPDGGRVEFVPTGDPMTTNIAFGGDGLRTAYLTLSGSGRLVSAAWPTPGLRLHFNG